LCHQSFFIADKNDERSPSQIFSSSFREKKATTCHSAFAGIHTTTMTTTKPDFTVTPVAAVTAPVAAAMTAEGTVMMITRLATPINTLVL